jgi:hypothetical protein
VFKHRTLSAAIAIGLLSLSVGHGAWHMLSPLPYNVSDGGALSPYDYYSDSGVVWAICGNNDDANNFLYYTTSSNSWTDMSYTVPGGVTFGDGACMTFLRGQEGKLLVFTGNGGDPGDPGAWIFHKYYVYRARNQIGLFPNLWQPFVPPSSTMGTGAALTCHQTSTPTSEVADVYAFQGNDVGFFTTTCAFPAGLTDNDGTIGAYPPENAVIGTNHVTIDWTDVTACSTYQVQISRNSTFTDLVDNATLNKGEFVSSSLLDGNYLWRVRFKYGNAYLDWTSGVPFTVSTSLPKPANGAFIATPYPTFLWSADLNAVQYEVVVTKSGSTTAVVDSTLTNTTLIAPTSLPAGLYSWRYGVIDSKSTVTWHTVGTFEVYTASFGGNSYQPLRQGAVLDWFPVEGATLYDVQIASDSGFLSTSVVFEDSTTDSKFFLSQSLANTLRVGPHYWRYRYHLGGTAWSDWVRLPDPWAPIWTVLPGYPQDVGTGGSLVYTSYGGGSVYGIRGGDEASWNFNSFLVGSTYWGWRTDFNRDSTTGPDAGASVVWTLGDYLYAILGNGTRVFKSYKLSSDTWVSQTNIPYQDGVSGGGSLSYSPGYDLIYCMVGNDTNLFYRNTPPDNNGGGGQSAAGTEARRLSMSAGPNPALGNVTVRYALATEGSVSLRVLDAQGRLVRQLATGNQPSGEHEFVWNRTSTRGSPVSRGIYFIQLLSRDENLNQKLVVQ